MACSNCGAQLSAGVKFCPECGARQASLCAACGTPLLPGAKFCAECGTPTSEAAAARRTEPGDPSGSAAGPSGGPYVDGSRSPGTHGAAAGRDSGSERRLVSVLFADLVGFTHRADEADGRLRDAPGGKAAADFVPQ